MDITVTKVPEDGEDAPEDEDTKVIRVKEERPGTEEREALRA